MPYRAGYEATDRVDIEQGLSTRRLQGVISTSALEMGIDIPDLDVCIMLGIPGSKMSMLQRMGRVGRSRPGSIIVVAGDTGYDRYYCQHPNDFFDRPVKNLTINNTNRIILLNHFACARAEAASFDHPKLDADIFGDDFITTAKRVRDFEYTDDILYNQSPHFQVSIRALDDPTFEIKEKIGHGKDNPVIGTINYSQVLREAYEGALYGHKGRKYRVDKISHGSKEIIVYLQNYQTAQTQPKKEIFVKERQTSVETPRYQWPGVQVVYSNLGIVEKVFGCKEKSLRGESKEFDYPQPLMRYFPTSGLVLRLDGLNNITHGAVVGLAAAFDATYPILCRCTKDDIGVFGWSKEQKSGTIYLYDNVAGGLGITQNAVTSFIELLHMTLEQIKNCECRLESEDTGCIHCVLGNSWLNYPAENVRQDTLALLEEILHITNSQQAKIFTTKSGKSKNQQVKEKATFGQTMITAGSTVFTPTHCEGVVLDSKPIQDKLFCDRIYTIRIGNETKNFLGQKLSIIHGGIEHWCTNCGAEYIDMQEKQCPYCNATLI